MIVCKKQAEESQEKSKQHEILFRKRCQRRTISKKLQSVALKFYCRPFSEL